MALDDGFADFGDAGDGGVAGEVVLDGLDGGVFDVAGRGEVRLAGAEVGEVDALGLHLERLGGDGHGRGDFDAVDAVGEELCGGCAHESSLADVGRGRKGRRREFKGVCPACCS